MTMAAIRPLTGLLALLIFLALAAGITGCAKKEEGGRTLNFVSWKPSQHEVWNEALEIFKRRHPDIKVTREIGPHSSTAYHDLLTQKLKNRDESVDVFFIDVIWPQEFAAAGWTLPLDEYFSEKEREKFLNGPVLANTYGGSIYGVPFWTSGGLFYFRKDLLTKYGFSPPETWEEMLRQSRTIIEGEKERLPNLKAFSGQFKQYEGLICNMLEYVMGNGGTLTDPETLTPRLAEREAVEAVRFVRDGIIGGAAPRGVLTYEEPESLALFIQGGAIFHRNWPYAWEVSNNTERSRIAGKVGIARIPHFEGGRSFSALGGWQFGINRRSRHPDLAWKFIEFMTGDEMQKFFALKAAQPPARKALYDDAEILKKNPHFAAFKEVFVTAYPRPRTPFYPAVSNILQKYFSKALSYPDSDIPALASEAEGEINALVEKYPHPPSSPG
jgi:multiple sugar transport system substrate-binding protein